MRFLYSNLYSLFEYINRVSKRIQLNCERCDCMRKFQPITPKNEKIVVSIRIESNKLEQIDDIATKIKISRNELINQCLNYALANLEFKKNIVKKSKTNENDF